MKNKEKKVSLLKCLGIFDRIKMPWLQIFVGFLFTIFSAWAALTTVTFSGNAVDASGNIPTEELFKYIFATVTSLALLIVGGIASSFAQVRIQYLVRNDVWKKMMSAKQKTFDFIGGEKLISRVTSDCDYASKFFDALGQITSILVSATMYIMQLWMISKKIATWILVFIPIAAILGGIYLIIRFTVVLKTQEKLAVSTAYLAERTKDLNLIKTCNAQNFELEKGKAVFYEQYKAQLKMEFSGMFATVIGTCLDIFSKVVPFMIGAVLVAEGEITVGVLVTVNTLFGSVASVVGNLITQSSYIKEANGALARVTTFLDAEEENVSEGSEMALGSEADIQLDAVSFGYNEEKVLKDISCTIPKNKVTAIIGTNGSGKSTLFKLLIRLYEPDEGVVSFGDEIANGYSLDSWRKNICLIAQGSPMMAGTIRENICYGRHDEVSEEELMNVAKLSHVWDFVKDLPQGFDSKVAGGGSNFSGGQRQCIAIARAMLTKAEYLLLDESTSNLDVKREKDVMEAMAELMKGRTTVIIAHSISAIKNADHVIVLNKGKIEASGTPEQIIAQTDNYLKKMINRNGSALQPGV